MPVKSTFPPSRTIPSSALALFLAATFLITWGVIGIYILAPDTAARSLGEISGSHPLFFLATWGIWHLPAFFLAGVVFADWDFLPFFIGNVTLAVLVTPIFNSTRGSLLWPMLFHWQLINPFWADAQPWDTWILVLVTIIVVWRSRDTMFTREGAVTEVIPTTRSDAPQPAE